MKQASHCRSVLFALFIAALCCGCNKKLSEVSGKVTVAGAPVEKGTISFLPRDGHGGSAAVAFEHGAYTIAVKPGDYRVEVLGYRIDGKRPVSEDNPKSPLIDNLVPIVPDQYNENSKLTCQVDAKPQQYDLTLDGQ